MGCRFGLVIVLRELAALNQKSPRRASRLLAPSNRALVGQPSWLPVLRASLPAEHLGGRDAAQTGRLEACPTSALSLVRCKKNVVFIQYSSQFSQDTAGESFKESLRVSRRGSAGCRPAVFGGSPNTL